MDEKTINTRMRGHALLSYATHFAERDWDWTRKTGIKRFYTESFRERLTETAKSAARRAADRAAHKLPVTRAGTGIPWWRMIRAYWQMHNNLPDGILDGGNVVAFWEETGEYLQMMQPSVGELVARFLIEEPENPWAQKIAEELDRIARRYAERVEKGEVE